MQDLFEVIETLPSEVQEIIQRYQDLDNTYGDCEYLLGELELVGYTFEYGLDGIPYNLQKI